MLQQVGSVLDLHWICDCPCPVLKDSRDSILDTDIPNFLRDIQLLTQQKQPYLFPQLQDLCRALRTGLINSPHREPLWKGTWTSPLVNSLADTARANTRQNPWRSSAALSTDQNSARLWCHYHHVCPQRMETLPQSSLPNPPTNMCTSKSIPL